LPFKEGSLVSPTAEIPMTTVSDTKIVRAYFSMNEKQVLYFNRTLKDLQLPKLKLSSGQPNFIDNSGYTKRKITTMNGLVNSTTGTTEFRAEFIIQGF
jgi:membrane fusion protein (multidrug efflux system)